MTVNRTATLAGKKYQRDVMKYLRERGWDAENLVLTGSEDEGDILLRLGRLDGLSRFVIEAKREQGFKIGSWIAQAELERDNYEKHRTLAPGSAGFVVVHARRNHALGKSYVTTTLDEWLRSQR